MDQGLVRSNPAAGILREEWPEYRLVIPADEPVSRQVRQLRTEWKDRYGDVSVSERPPCITLACLPVREDMEDMLMRWIGRICACQPAFTVTLNNFSAIPPQMVYIRVQDATPFRHMAERLHALDDFIRSPDGRQPRIFDRPFIKIGAMPATATQDQWFGYAHQLFHAAFTARQLLLLKRDKEDWKTVSLFPFKG